MYTRVILLYVQQNYTQEADFSANQNDWYDAIRSYMK